MQFRHAISLNSEWDWDSNYLISFEHKTVGQVGILLGYDFVLFGIIEDNFPNLKSFFPGSYNREKWFQDKMAQLEAKRQWAKKRGQESNAPKEIQTLEIENKSGKENFLDEGSYKFHQAQIHYEHTIVFRRPEEIVAAIDCAFEQGFFEAADESIKNKLLKAIQFYKTLMMVEHQIESETMKDSILQILNNIDELKILFESELFKRCSVFEDIFDVRDVYLRLSLEYVKLSLSSFNRIENIKLADQYYEKSITCNTDPNEETEFSANRKAIKLTEYWAERMTINKDDSDKDAEQAVKSFLSAVNNICTKARYYAREAPLTELLVLCKKWAALPEDSPKFILLSAILKNYRSDIQEKLQNNFCFDAVIEIARIHGKVALKEGDIDTAFEVIKTIPNKTPIDWINLGESKWGMQPSTTIIEDKIRKIDTNQTLQNLAAQFPFFVRAYMGSGCTDELRQYALGMLDLIAKGYCQFSGQEYSTENRLRKALVSLFDPKNEFLTLAGLNQFLLEYESTDEKKMRTKIIEYLEHIEGIEAYEASYKLFHLGLNPEEISKLHQLKKEFKTCGTASVDELLRNAVSIIPSIIETFPAFKAIFVDRNILCNNNNNNNNNNNSYPTKRAC